MFGGPLVDGQGAWLRRRLAEAGVLVLRMPRALDDDELQAVASLFGPIKDPVGRTRDGGLLRYTERRQVIDSGFVLTDPVREKLGPMHFGGLDDDRPGLFETWHCDDTYTERPARSTVLHARALPPGGGGPTCFLDMRAAYAGLEPALRRRIDALRVVYAFNNEGVFPPRRACRGEGEALVDVVHPLVRVHPETGTRALFLDLDRACRVDELPTGEGRALLQSLQDHAEAHAPRCEHVWRPHDVLVWDNASVQHKARGDFAKGEPRRFWRYMVQGEAPAAVAGRVVTRDPSASGGAVLLEARDEGPRRARIPAGCVVAHSSGAAVGRSTHVSPRGGAAYRLHPARGFQIISSP